MPELSVKPKCIVLGRRFNLAGDVSGQQGHFDLIIRKTKNCYSLKFPQIQSITVNTAVGCKL